MTIRSDGEDSKRNDTGSGDVRAGADAEVDSRPATAGYPSAADAGSVVDEAATPTDDRDRAGYPDATGAAEPN
jgi:hypothetical protein